jgi:D-serine deaminase-like pyridoxal phosphate-dependent protein
MSSGQDSSSSHETRFRAVLDAIGTRNSRDLLPTPALICHPVLLKENIAAMAALTASWGIALRPHVKSHKSAYVAHLQLEAGAVGRCFAKLSEAEVILDRLGATGFTQRVSALITSPLVGRLGAQRARALARVCDLILVVDDVSGVHELAQAFENSIVPLSLLIDVDVGLGRTGVVRSDDAVQLANEIRQYPHLRLLGVQGYAGHVQRIKGRANRTAAATIAAERLSTIVRALEVRGYPVALRTGAGTGTTTIDHELGLLNEFQPGSYVFMDREYREALADDVEGNFHQSLTIETTVVSINQETGVTVDAGLKAMATDAGVPLVIGEETATYSFFGDEHGFIENLTPGSAHRGERLQLLPPHCDPTIDRYDHLWFVDDDVVVGVTNIDARGCSQ